jgi:hypothetical protein
MIPFPGRGMDNMSLELATWSKRFEKEADVGIFQTPE